MKKISSRQLMIIYCIYSFSIKFLMLPGILAQSAGQDCWLSALFGTVIELAVLFIALTSLTLNNNNNMYADLCAHKSRNPFSIRKIILVIMFSVFLLQLLILINQSFFLLSDNLFENIHLQYFSIPMLLLGIFFCFMPTRAIFRSGEIFYIFIIIGIVISVFPALSQIKPTEILPVFDKGIAPSIKGLYHNLIYFESTSLLLMFSGDIKIERHFRKKFMLFATVLGLFFVFFIFMFYSLFGPLAETKTIAISHMTLYSTFLTQSGRLDWVLITIWLLLLLLRFGITFFCTFVCIRLVTGIKNRAGILSISLAVFIYCISTFVFTRGPNNLLSSVPWLIASFYFIIPIFFLIFAITEKNKNSQKARKHVKAGSYV